MIPTVKGDDVTREELTHNVRGAGGAAAKEEMGMIGKEGPRITGGLCFRKKKGQTSNEVLSIFVTAEDIPSLDPPDHHMMERSGNIEGGLDGAYLRKYIRRTHRVN